MVDFSEFSKHVAQQFNSMKKADELFVVDLDKDELWDLYLSSFPEGTDPIYIERTQHDCNCCKNFIRDIGGVISIVSGKISTIWDISINDDTYQIVADNLAEKVKAATIKNVYRHNIRKIGKLVTRQVTDTGAVISWNHFEVSLPNSVLVNGGRSLGDIRGEFKGHYDVLKRSVEEISHEAIETVLELISQNSLYRGQEHLSTVKNLSKLKKGYEKAKKKDSYLWSKASEYKFGARFRNTVIGTLLTDLSTGVDLERAVKSFEEKVAPTNYKRPKALITQSMINKAQEKVEELGIESSLYRRYAAPSDLTVNNVLFADRTTRTKMKDGLFADIKPTKGNTQSFNKVQEVTVDYFVENILPHAESVEVFVENSHMNNMMSLIAPVYPDAPNILKWDNNFSWSYNGEVTDSIRERVKSAGGSIDGDVRVSLSWSNYDDLDIHVTRGSDHIYFGNRIGKCGGKLDVDMNAGGRNSREPVENITWANKATMKPGLYKVYVNNFNKRETKDVGFEVEVQIGSATTTYSYPEAVPNRGNVPVIEFEVDKDRNVKIKKEFIASTTMSKEFWGIETQNFVKVDMVLNSPNHWDGQSVGNKHLFFILDGCKNPDSARGFYNEFLRGDLNEHRKVFEILSSKMKTPESDEQLSGLGFSTTQQNELYCKVSGSFNRTIKIKQS